jgi:hypothetical protein
MCAWCETSLTDPPSSMVALPAYPTDPLGLAPDDPRYGPPARPEDWDERASVATVNLLVIGALAVIALACPVAVTVLLHKQEAVDRAGSYYSGPYSHVSNEFPVYGALSIIPSLVCALAVYLIFRWVTRLRFDED